MFRAPDDALGLKRGVRRNHFWRLLNLYLFFPPAGKMHFCKGHYVNKLEPDLTPIDPEIKSG